MTIELLDPKQVLRDTLIALYIDFFGDGEVVYWNRVMMN